MMVSETLSTMTTLVVTTITQTSMVMCGVLSLQPMHGQDIILMENHGTSHLMVNNNTGISTTTAGKNFQMELHTTMTTTETTQLPIQMELMYSWNIKLMESTITITTNQVEHNTILARMEIGGHTIWLLETGNTMIQVPLQPLELRISSSIFSRLMDQSLNMTETKMHSNTHPQISKTKFTIILTTTLELILMLATGFQLDN